MDIRDAASLISAHHAARSAEEFINRFSKMCWLRDEIMGTVVTGPGVQNEMLTEY